MVIIVLYFFVWLLNADFMLRNEVVPTLPGKSSVSGALPLQSGSSRETAFGDEANRGRLITGLTSARTDSTETQRQLTQRPRSQPPGDLLEGEPSKQRLDYVMDLASHRRSFDAVLSSCFFT